MISEFWSLNLTGGILLALIALAATVELRSTSLVPKAAFLWPTLVVVYGMVNLVAGWWISEFVLGALGVVLTLCGVQAALVSMRRLRPWPSGMIWLGLVLIGLISQTHSLFVGRVIGFIWVGVGISKIARERSAALEAGTPLWILLLYAQAVLLGSFK